jgi:hypothetical protein
MYHPPKGRSKENAKKKVMLVGKREEKGRDIF